MALFSAVTLIFFHPLLLISRVWSARRLEPRGIRDPGIWAVITAAVLSLVAYLVLAAAFVSGVSMVALGLIFFSSILIGIAATQFLHNRIVREHANPLHFDIIIKGSRHA